MQKTVFLSLFCFFFVQFIFAQKKEITVTNTEDFLNAIGSNRIINIKEGAFEITAFEGLDLKPNTKYMFVDAYDGFELVIKDVEDLIIRGIGNRASELIARPQYGVVLAFQGCNRITLENIEAGHGPEKGYCTGGVIRISGGGDYNFKNCILYGSGTEGITADNITNLVCENTTIHGCTYGMMSFRACQNLTFKNCDFRDNEEFEMVMLEGTEKVLFDNCHFKRNQAKSDFMGLFFKVTAPKDKIKLQNCKFQHNNAKYFAERQSDFEFINTNLDDNTFRTGTFQGN